ncbi:MAG: hypothetical protein OEM41_04750 [Ignavibacteria bacterium]|nr:hypothetical protein [Ignavibacteria bacterium]
MNHQHNERNAGSHGALHVLREEEDSLLLRCTGSSGSGDVSSSYIIAWERAKDPLAYVVQAEASLTVQEGRNWPVAYNPHHGELEFCNLWPEGTFVTTGGSKRYQCCCVVRGNTASRIAHHHLESSDKHDIQLNEGDMFTWLLEDENPVLRIESDQKVHAGLCAYMWDAHFAYRAENGKGEILLPSGSTYRARFSLFAIDRAEGKRILESAVPAESPELRTTPLYSPGMNRFSETGVPDEHSVWPWSTELPRGNSQTVVFARDEAIGFDDTRSLRISSQENATARWVATTLGPAFGGTPFRDNARHRLSARILTRELRGNVTVALRLHREGVGDVFRLEDYVMYHSPKVTESRWDQIEVTTPPISPPPDRIHLILEQEGTGTSWFDNVLYEQDD